MASTANSTIAPAASTLNPAVFLGYFTELGGGYYLNPEGQLWLGVVQTGTPDADRKLAAQLMRQITQDEAARIRDHLVRSQSAGEA